ncbi:DNA binding domain-containing protein, excisionase family [Jiangella alkaliphila]|uniref:DNA binding domain-containing protein, excisionase family n=1 Tax=Jiangella alkaliphila TaxID=419479 RepID=A0A1H2JRD3_9ACTN|nr:DNA binding domain-containing protein, excisionase family [Jiangella alkaliphila]
MHLSGMNSETRSDEHDEPPAAPGLGNVVGETLTLQDLATQLGVTVQTLYDLRSQGRGPRGFRVGRELQFRRSEIDAWLAWMEGADAKRHPRGGSR